MTVVYKNIHTGKFFNWDKYYEKITPEVDSLESTYDIKKEDSNIKEASKFSNDSEYWKFIHFFNKNYKILELTQELIEKEIKRDERRDKLKKLEQNGNTTI